MSAEAMNELTERWKREAEAAQKPGVMTQPVMRWFVLKWFLEIEAARDK